MQSQLNPEQDGTGGGYGKFPGIPVAQIVETFQTALDDASMRSVSLVLRITREQIEARGHLGSYRWMAGVAGVILVVALPLSFILKGPIADGAQKTAGAGAIACLALSAGIYSTRHATANAMAQEQEIRRLAIEALTQIVASEGFKPKPLNNDQHRILQELLKKTKCQDPALHALL